MKKKHSRRRAEKFSREESAARLMGGLGRYADAPSGHKDFWQTGRTVHDLHLRGVFGEEMAGTCTVDWSPVKQLLAAVLEPGLYGALRGGDDDEVERICAKIMQSPTKSAWWPALEYALMALPTKLDEALQETVAEAIEFHTLLAHKPADSDITTRVEEIRRPAAQTARDRLRLLRTRAPGRPSVPDLRDRVMWALYDSESQSRVAKTLGVSVSKLSKWAAASEFGDWRGVVEYHRRLRALDFSGLPSQREAGNEDEEQG